MVRRITSRNTITIPKRALEQVGAGEGTYFEITDDGTRIILTPKEIGDRLTDEEWKKLDRLRKEKGTVYEKASGAKSHLRRLRG